MNCIRFLPDNKVRLVHLLARSMSIWLELHPHKLIAMFSYNLQMFPIQLTYRWFDAPTHSIVQLQITTKLVINQTEIHYSAVWTVSYNLPAVG